MERDIKIAITSGKGGTGKTTVSTGLFYMLSKHLKYTVQLLDCDVEEPDCHIFIKALRTAGFPVTTFIPVIDTERCTFCGKCKSICAYNSLIMLPSASFIEVVEDMCHGCGACLYVCNEKAITEGVKEIGTVNCHEYHAGDDFIEGRLQVGSALQTRVIRETLNYAKQKGITLYDSPPGTSCPVVAAISKADYVIMVTEPTPFGLYDLKLMINTVRQLKKDHGIVINKAGLEFRRLYDYIKNENIPLLGEIPFKREYARDYSLGRILPETDSRLRDIFTGIIHKVLNGKTV